MQSLNSSEEHGAHQSHPTIAWPQLGTAPISEFTTEGYILAAFPTLFPNEIDYDDYTPPPSIETI